MIEEPSRQTGINESIVRLAKQYSKKIRENINSNNITTAQEYIDKLINLGESNNNPYAATVGHLHLSALNCDLLYYEQAIKYGLKALDISSKIDDDDLKSDVYMNLGNCFGITGDQDKALEYFLKSLEYNPDNPDTFNHIGICYYEKNQPDIALKYYKKACKIYKKKGQNNHMAFTLINIARYYFETGNPEKAMQNYREALAISVQEKKDKITRLAFASMGQVYLKQKKYIQAEKNFIKALELAEKNNYQPTKAECYLGLSQLYEEKQDYKQSLAYSKLCLETREVILKDETKEKIDKIHSRFELERKQNAEREKYLQTSKQEIEKKFHNLQTAYTEVTGIGQFGVFSEKMRNVVKMAELLHADRSVPVLIEGATGTGKEIVARIIHHGKLNDSRPFIVLNCAAISPTLFESELFGYEEGAFTGSRKDGMIGKFEMAQGGTIFLDEIGELPLDLQPKLLRTLQQKEIYRISGNKPIKLDVRVICATNRDLKTEMEEKRFRNDLYFRLNTGRIFIPPLKERKEEIAPLAQMFLLSFAHLKKRHFQYISKPALEI
ncbi:MAG: sigma 54-interacting transcriptional regulator, partial [Thermodesulfovibrionia bacterium]|nr:sigma 54-interacting transcriptional regulator [Thermodesulfovibrionia bacterium]